MGIRKISSSNNIRLPKAKKNSNRDIDYNDALRQYHNYSIENKSPISFSKFMRYYYKK